MELGKIRTIDGTTLDEELSLDRHVYHVASGARRIPLRKKG